MSSSRPASRYVYVFLALTAALVLYGYSPWGLWETDEGRYADVARSMLERGDFVTPRINGVVFLDKPPLVYWTTAASLALFGSRDFAARLPQLLFAGGTLLAVYGIGALLHDRRRALVATFVLATSVGFFMGSHVLTLDLGLTFFVTLALFCFLRAIREPDGGLRWYLAMFAAAAGGMLTKGLLGVLLPSMTIACFLTLRGEWRRVREVPWIRGALVFLAIAAPWFIAVSIANPEFPRYFFIHEHLDRLATSIHGREGGWLYYVGAMGMGLFPWCLASPLVFIRTSDRDRALIAWPRSEASALILSWLVPGFLLFTIARSKLPLYALPLYPAAALGLAVPLTLPAHVAERSKRALSWTGVAVLAAVVGVASFWIDIRDAAFAIRSQAPPSLVIALATLMTIATAACWLLSRSGRRLAGMATLGALTTLSVYIGMAVIGRDNFINETRYFAGVLKSEMRPGDKIYAYRCYLRGLPFYLSQTVGVSARYSDDIEIGRGLTHDQESFVSDSDLIAALMGEARTFVVLRHERMQGLQRKSGLPLYVLARSEHHDLVSNRLSDYASHEIIQGLDGSRIDLASAMARARRLLPGGQIEMIEIERAPRDLDLVLDVEAGGSQYDVRFPLTGGRQASVTREDESEEESGKEEHLLRLVASAKDGPAPPAVFFTTPDGTAEQRARRF